MNTKTQNFLAKILGPKGLKTVESLQKTESAEIIIPRAILSWVSTVCKLDKFEGCVPGNDNYINLVKSDNSFNGSVAVDGELYRFENKSPFYVASLVSLCLGVDLENFNIPLNKAEINKIGDKIDLLAKTKFINEQKAKRHLKFIKLTKNELDKKCGVCNIPEFKDDQFVGCHCFKDLSKSVKLDRVSTGFIAYFDKKWDSDSMKTLIEILKK